MTDAELSQLCNAQAVLAVVIERTRVLIACGDALGDGTACEVTARDAWGTAQKLREYIADWPFCQETSEVQATVDQLSDYAREWLDIALERQRAALSPIRGSHE